jgi:hypothetical protein
LQYSVGVPDPPLQLAGLQTVEVPGNAPHDVGLPLHCASQTPVPVHFARTPCGCPLESVEQVPTLPVTSHAWHWPAHALLQHTPSTQLPEPHCEAIVHAAPFGSAQVPIVFALQTRPLEQVAVVQHTPFVQLPLVHCEALVQIVPSAPVVTQMPEELQK